jgi:hypothetical protein
MKKSSVAAHTEATITIHVPCPGNQAPTTIPEIIDKRRGITGRE